jgi:hypothetical protein
MPGHYSRRDILKIGALSALASLVPGLRADPGRRFKTILWISPDGGAPQTDTLDPKPDAPEAVRGPFRAIPTAVPGVQVSELFPRTAAVLNRVTLLRARRANSTDHLRAMQEMLRREPDGRHLLTRHAERARGMPYAYAETPGVLSAFPYRQDAYGVPRMALEVQWDDRRRRFLPPPLGEGGPALDGRMRLLRRLDTLPDNEQTRRMAELRERAYRLINETRAGLRLPERDLARYGGDNPVSVGALTMRELVRQGVTGALFFRAGNWDYHDNLVRDITRDAPPMDHALAALITDVKRGLLGETLLVYSGEFGRGPMSSLGGRDHFSWHTSLLAGPGIREGYVYGATDNRMEGRSGIVDDETFASLVQEAAGNEPDYRLRSRLPPVFS